ncbi:MAG: prohibitin family protein [Pseudobdellovibrionaceae bacterium]|nr:prohibitin family protein [Pseudobdellovibrionaceae bacterium]
MADLSPKTVLLALVAFLAVIFAYSSFYVVDPGNRGIIVTLGKTDPVAKPEGVGFKAPFMSKLHQVSIRQQTEGLKAECYSSDLQQVSINLKVLYRVPENRVISIFTQFAGNPFDSLLAPRVQEAIKEATALESAEGIVKARERIKLKVLEAAQKKIQELVIIEDVVIENVSLSPELEKAIEEKMVQEQEAAKSKFLKDKAKVEAETAEIRAAGEARAIDIRGEAIRKNPGIIDLQMIEKWNGVSPLVVGQTTGSFVLPLNKK